MFWKKKSKGSKSMTFLPSNKTVYFDSQHSVLELCLENKVELSNSCEGMGSCGTCQITVKSDLKNINARNSVEQLMAKDRDFTDQERLACQTTAVNGLIVEIPEQQNQKE